MHKWTIITKLSAATIMIIAGAIIYVISRHDIIFFRWIPTTIINTFRGYTVDSNSSLGYFFAYCLPDGLWYGALLLVQCSLLEKSFTSRIIYWASIVLPFIWEILQVYDVIPGTFDPMDLVVYLLVFIIFITNSKQST